MKVLWTVRAKLVAWNEKQTNSDRLGLEAWEMREIGRATGVLLLMMLFVVVPAGAAVGLHWVAVAYAAGAALAWAALRTDGSCGFGGRLRRVLAWICGWELRFIPAMAAFFAGLKVLAEAVPAPLKPLKGLWDPEVTKAEIARAVEEALRRVPAEAEPWVLAAGVSGIAGALLWGMADWLLLGSVSARHGVSPWRVLGFGRARWDWREHGARERARRRRLLRGEE